MTNELDVVNLVAKLRAYDSILQSFMDKSSIRMLKYNRQTVVELDTLSNDSSSNKSSTNSSDSEHDQGITYLDQEKRLFFENIRCMLQ